VKTLVQSDEEVDLDNCLLEKEVEGSKPSRGGEDEDYDLFVMQGESQVKVVVDSVDNCGWHWSVEVTQELSHPVGSFRTILASIVTRTVATS